MQEFVLRADCILSLHGWSKEASVLPYAEYPDGSSVAAQKSRDAAHALAFPYLHPYTWPAGVLGDAALRHGIPTVECEIGGMGTTTPEGRARYREVILRFLDHFQLLRFDAPATPQPMLIGHTDVAAHSVGLSAAQWRWETKSRRARRWVAWILWPANGSRKCVRVAAGRWDCCARWRRCNPATCWRKCSG